LGIGDESMTAGDDDRLERARRDVHVLSHPSVLVVIDLLARLGLRITATTIRERMGAWPTFPSIGLVEIGQMFERWGIPSTAFRAPPDKVTSVRLPVIALLENAGLDGDFDLVVVTAWHDETVELSHPMMGAMAMAWPQFLACWTGVMVAAGFDPAAEEPDFEARREAEVQAAAAWRRAVRIVEDFLDAEECARIIRTCEQAVGFAPSPTVLLRPDGSSVRRSAARTSHTATLADRSPAGFAPLYARAAALIGVETGRIEDFQCVRYDPGQEFKPHVDGLDRSHTLLVYLNDDFAGGETWFPEIDLVVPPKRGSALLFGNFDAAGRAVPWSRHAGLPPREGRKYACNIWARAVGPVAGDAAAKS